MADVETVPSAGLSTARYYVSLFGRSQRWLPPTLLYGAALGIEAGGGDYLADAYAYSAALLLPAVAWLTRAMLTTEPPQIRDITSGAHGPESARFSALLAATGYGLLFAALGALVAQVAGSGAPPPGNWAATAGPAATTGWGIGVELVCVLLGTASGAIAAPPVLIKTGRSVLATAIISLALAFAPFSPANLSIRSLFDPAGPTTAVLLSAGPLTLVLTAATWFIAAKTAARR